MQLNEAFEDMRVRHNKTGRSGAIKEIGSHYLYVIWDDGEGWNCDPANLAPTTEQRPRQIIWTLTTDTNSSGFETRAFHTEAQRDAAAWELMTTIAVEAGLSERPDPAKWYSISDAWQYFRSNDLDSLWLEDVEVEGSACTYEGNNNAPLR